VGRVRPGDRYDGVDADLYRGCAATLRARLDIQRLHCGPPRLAEQPIFYPVLNEEYAMMITRDWNVKALRGRLRYPLSGYAETSSTASRRTRSADRPSWSIGSPPPYRRHATRWVQPQDRCLHRRATPFQNHQAARSAARARLSFQDSWVDIVAIALARPRDRFLVAGSIADSTKGVRKGT